VESNAAVAECPAPLRRAAESSNDNDTTGCLRCSTLRHVMLAFAALGYRAPRPVAPDPRSEDCPARSTGIVRTSTTSTDSMRAPSAGSASCTDDDINRPNAFDAYHQLPSWCGRCSSPAAPDRGEIWRTAALRKASTDLIHRSSAHSDSAHVR
jgi:hypothetical protein